MESTPSSGPFDGDGLSDHDRQTLATLEHSLDAGRIHRTWARYRLRLWAAVTSQARPFVAGGLAAILAGLAVIWFELSAAIWLAAGGECLLTVGALLLAQGTRIWWHKAHTHAPFRR